MDCAGFLQWALPRLRLRWEGYRRVRRQVCKRLSRRMAELRLSDFSDYRGYLEASLEEWPVLDSLCGITISRFYRDRGVFDALQIRLLPCLAADVLRAGGKEVLCWSAGCAAGEEPYTLQIIWRTVVVRAAAHDIPLRIIATDVNEGMLKRARQGRYPAGSLRDLPGRMREAFLPCDDVYSVREPYRENIEFLGQDIRLQLPEGGFHLILCRNLVFTYFDEGLQRETLNRIMTKLMPGGILVLGRHEALPCGVGGISPVSNETAIFQREMADRA